MQLTMTDECPNCLSRKIEVRKQNGEFFAVCMSCGRRGGSGPGIFHALFEWRRSAGKKPWPAEAALLGIVLLLLATVLVLATASIVNG